MKDYLIEFACRETYNGDMLEKKMLISAEDCERAWARLQDLVKGGAEPPHTYKSFVLKDARVL